MDLNEVVARLHYMTGYKPQKRGYGYMAICPAHEDLQASLSVFKSNRSDRVIFNCFRGCDYKQVRAMIDVGDETSNKGKVQYNTTPFWELKIVKTYDYPNEQGEVLYQKVRFEPKAFALRYKRKNKWAWGRNGHQPILYNLPQVIQADVVWIAEGEKNVEVLTDWGLVGTCNFDGAGKWCNEYSKNLWGKTVYIIPDNDDAGMEHARLVQRNVGRVARVKIIQLPGLGYKQDLWDWRTMGFGLEDLLSLK